MGVPGEGFGPSRKKSRLCLNSKRKEIEREPSVADEQSVIFSDCKNEMMQATPDNSGSDGGQNGVKRTESRQPLVAPVSSLYNIGNTCYLNAILQALRYTPGFIRRLTKLRENIALEETSTELKVEPDGKKKSDRLVWKLVICLDNLYKQMRVKESDYTDICPIDAAMMAIRPDALLDQIRQLNPLFEGNYQHDAQELLRCLLSCLEDAEVELEKEQAERRCEKEKANATLTKENSQRVSVVDEKHTIRKMGVQPKVFQMTYAHHRRKKSKGNTDPKHKEGTTTMLDTFLVRNHNLASCNENKDTEDDMKNIKMLPQGDGIVKAKLECENDQQSDTMLSSEDKSEVECFGPVMHPSGDASISGLAHISPKPGSSNPDDKGKKRMRLGMRGHMPCLKRAGDISDFVDKRQKNVKNSDQNSDDVIVISSSEEDNSQLSCDEDVVSPCDNIITDEKEKQPVKFSSNGTLSLSSRDSKGSSPENESLSVLEEIEGTQTLLLSPGKKLVIHSSPQRENGDYSPKMKESKSFLSRVQSFLPESAKKFLNFSPKTDKPKSTNVPNTSTAMETETGVCAEMKLEKDAVVDKDGALHLTKETLSEARLKLKRCDWLGVSPTKSISAHLVSQRMRNQQSGGSSGSEAKRKINYGSEEDIPKRKKCKSIYRNKEDHVVNQKEMQGKPEDLDERVKDQTNNSDVIDGSVDGSVVCAKKLECEIKPLSIKLKKLNWLTDINQQYFNVQELLSKGKVDTKRQSVNRKKNVWSQHKLELYRDTENTQTLLHTTPVNSEGKISPLDNKLVQGLFGGAMGHSTRCCECEHSSHRSENFLDVSIPVRTESTRHRNGCSDEEDEGGSRNNKSCVFKLLKSLSTPERLCNDNKYFCDNCHHLVEAIHFCYFQDLPQVFAIHLKRFDAAGLGAMMGRVSKITDHVTVPASLPCLKRKCSHSNSYCQHRYSLCAVVTHSGSSILRGHYLSYVKVTSSFNRQMSGYVSGTGNENHSKSSSHSLPPTSSLSSKDSGSSLVGERFEDMKQRVPPTSPGCLQSEMDSQWSESTTNITSPPSSTHRGCVETSEEKSWWLECDDEFIRTFDEEEFQEKLTGEKDALLGTPYVLFYHQTNSC